MMSKLQTKKPANLIEKLDMEDVSFKQRVLHRLAANPREIIRAPEQIKKTFQDAERRR